MSYLVPGGPYICETVALTEPPPSGGGDCPTVAEIVAAVWNPANALAASSALRHLLDNGTEVYDRATDSLQATRDNSPTIQQVVDATLAALIAEIHDRTA